MPAIDRLKRLFGMARPSRGPGHSLPTRAAGMETGADTPGDVKVGLPGMPSRRASESVRGGAAVPEAGASHASTELQDQTDALISGAIIEHESAGRLGVRAPAAWEAAESTGKLLESVASCMKDLSRAADAIGAIHPYLQSATSLFSAIARPILNQDRRDVAFEGLLQEMVRTYQHVKDELDLGKTGETQPAKYETRLLFEISRVSKDCACFVRDEYIAKNFFARTAKNAVRGGSVDEKIQQFRSTFMDLRESWRDAKLKYLDADAILNRLRQSHDHGHTRDKACLAGTRTNALRGLSEWAHDPSGTRALFLVGVAGSGKSSIAHSVAATMRSKRLLGAFFAFDRVDDQRSPQLMISTIARELALVNEDYRDALVRVLKADPGVAASIDVRERWQRLLLEPAAVLPALRPLLLVVDAFDECPEREEDPSRHRLLLLLAEAVSSLPPGLRLLVTSRAEGDVLRASQPGDRLDLGDISARDDIQHYVRHRLPTLDEGGLDDTKCDLLAEASDGLFQWAATTCRFLEQRPAGTTMHRKCDVYWNQLLHGVVAIERGRPSLNDLYKMVLASALDVTDDEAMCDFRLVLCLVIRNSLSITALQMRYCALLGISEWDTVPNVVKHLGVVLEGIGDPGALVRPMHRSFADFLLEEDENNPWYIDLESRQTASHMDGISCGSHRKGVQSTSLITPPS